MKEELYKKNGIIWVTPENEEILKSGEMDNIFELLKEIAIKYQNETFNMMPKLENVQLSSNEVVEAVACANFMKGNIELIGIFLYDYTKTSYDQVKMILNQKFNN